MNSSDDDRPTVLLSQADIRRWRLDAAHEALDNAANIVQRYIDDCEPGLELVNLRLLKSEIIIMKKEWTV